MKITASPFYHALSCRKITPRNSLLSTSWFNNRNTGPCGVYLWGFYTGEYKENGNFQNDKFVLSEDFKERDFTIYYVGKIDHHGHICGCNNKLTTPPKLSNIGERLLQEWAWLFGGFYPTLKFDHFVNYPDNSNVWLYQKAKIGLPGPLLHKSEGLLSYQKYLSEYRPTRDFINSQIAMKERLMFCWISFDDFEENEKGHQDKIEAIRDVERSLHKICGENTLGLGQYQLGQSSNAITELRNLGVNFKGNKELKRYLEKVSIHTVGSNTKFREIFPKIKSCKDRIVEEIKNINAHGKTFYHQKP